jgi:phenylalanyl-tRNA synthetase beta chain
MGGFHEVDDTTTNVLIEAANFNFINIRKTTQQMKLPSEAATRFGRGIHPAMAIRGNIRSANLIQQLGGGTIDAGVVDNYANRKVPRYADVAGQRLASRCIEGQRIPSTLNFTLRRTDNELQVTGPDHRTHHRPRMTCGRRSPASTARSHPRMGMDDEIPAARQSAVGV